MTDRGPSFNGSAHTLLEEIRAYDPGALILRGTDKHTVFVITRVPRLAEFLLAHGATCFTRSGQKLSPDYPLGGYKKGKATEWDLYVHAIKVKWPNRTVWRAAAALVGTPVVDTVDYA